MEFPDLPSRLSRVRETVARHQALAGWTHPVRIIGVTKGHGAEAVRAAAAAGLEDVGENRVQEALEKQSRAGETQVTWHLIGTLQRNKARHAVGRFALIHSVDRADLGSELDRRSAPGARQQVLIQVNCSDEPQKGGVEPDALSGLVDELLPLAGLQVIGLMTMSALTEDAGEQRRAFRRLRELRDAAERGGHRLPELSMGMSGDFPMAVEEGATMIRLGTILFGARAA